MNESVRIMLESQFADLPPEFKPEIPNVINSAHPTQACPTGMRGRMAVFELLSMNAELEHLILTDPTEDSLFSVARTRGMMTMKEDAIIKSFNGQVPFSEIGKLGGMLLSETAAVDEEV